MKISIVTISYNQAEFLERAIQSVVCQKSGVDIEYIVVDAGSDDGSRDVLARYNNEIDCLILESDEGPPDGLNKGFSHATGDIYGYLNADDEFISDSLGEVVEYFKTHSNIDVVSAHGEIIDRDDNLIQKCFSHKFNLQRYIEGNCVLVQQSTFFRAEAFKLTNGFNKDNLVSWDGELMLDMALNHVRFSRLHRYWSRFRVYDQSISGSGEFIDKALNEQERLARKVSENAVNPVRKKIFWLLSRLSDPVLLFLRIKDGLKNGGRVIPKH